MNASLDQSLVSELQALCVANETARRLFFEGFAQRQKDSRTTTVDRAARTANADYSSMIQVFKKLDQIGAGRFIAGRHGHSSRMEWKYSLRSLSAVAQGKGRKLEQVPSDAVNEDAISDRLGKLALLDHEFQLRGDLKIKFSLPADLTEKEAERLGAFLKTLPL
ncbi:MAG: hypothetical protein J7498_11990 [Sphingobium sp.]|nr:hypothetical protein [Sphingobium sp.]